MNFLLINSMQAALKALALDEAAVGAYVYHSVLGHVGGGVLMWATIDSGIESVFMYQKYPMYGVGSVIISLVFGL